MEVDLVVSFDANVSPLRMIQRMGRTGRKHDGQVVVLACEGTEMKGYLRKQAKSKAISKHMRNGGINSFIFHPSARMIPHVFKPEVQFIELSIEKFIPREKKVKDDSIQIPASTDKLTVPEIDLLVKYFHTTGENTWRPSLIAFPHFQTHPSREHKVNHSCRTVMLIDTMQRLRGQVSLPGNNKTSTLQKSPCLEDSNPIDITELDEVRSDNESRSRYTIGNNEVLDSCHLGIQTEDFVYLTVQDKTLVELRSPSSSCIKKDDLLSSRCCDLDENQENTCEVDETIPETPIPKRATSNDGHTFGETPHLVRIKASLMLEDAFNKDMKDEEYSPRLTNFIDSGVVPESPVDERGDLLSGVIRNCNPPAHLQTEQQTSSLISGENEKVIIDTGTGVNISTSPVDSGTQTPVFERKSCAIRRGRVLISPMVEGGQTPVADSINHSFSEESVFGCGEMSGSVKPVHRFKRLRKANGSGSDRNDNSKKDYVIPTENLVKSSSKFNFTRNKRCQGRRKSMQNVRVFIDEEAEVSSEAEVSNDEDGEDDSSLDSFIDDRMNPTASSQPGASRIDMMAIYRRSLLSQTPFEGGINVSATISPDHVSSMTKISENADSSVERASHLETPQIDPMNQSDCKSSESVGINQITSVAVPSNGSLAEITRMRSRKRKLTFHRPGYLPNINLEHEFALESNQESMDANADASRDILCDDHIFDNLDLDELEAQATSLLKQKVDLSTQKQGTILQSHPQNPLFNPSFDLGI